MLVQTLNHIVARFQNRRVSTGDPLARFDVSPLLPLRSLLWGWVENEHRRLTVRRRAAEYEFEYGLPLIGRAVPRGRDARGAPVGFLRGVPHGPAPGHVFFKELDDLTITADGFPLYEALRECHLVLSQGSQNQYGEMAVAARAEMLVMQHILAQPPMREFLGGRPMTPYPEPWMDRVDSMKAIQGWSRHQRHALPRPGHLRRAAGADHPARQLGRHRPSARPEAAAWATAFRPHDPALHRRLPGGDRRRSVRRASTPRCRRRSSPAASPSPPAGRERRLHLGAVPRSAPPPPGLWSRGRPHHGPAPGARPRPRPAAAAGRLAELRRGGAGARVRRTSLHALIDVLIALIGAGRRRRHRRGRVPREPLGGGAAVATSARGPTVLRYRHHDADHAVAQCRHGLRIARSRGRSPTAGAGVQPAGAGRPTWPPWPAEAAAASSSTTRWPSGVLGPPARRATDRARLGGRAVRARRLARDRAPPRRVVWSWPRWPRASARRWPSSPGHAARWPRSSGPADAASHASGPTAADLAALRRRGRHACPAARCAPPSPGPAHRATCGAGCGSAASPVGLPLPLRAGRRRHPTRWRLVRSLERTGFGVLAVERRCRRAPRAGVVSPGRGPAGRPPAGRRDRTR